MPERNLRPKRGDGYKGLAIRIFIGTLYVT
jgi:hypothetical protein